MQKLLSLKPGDSVEIIAPASRCTDERLAEIKELLASWQLDCIVSPDIFGKDLLCANSDDIRFESLKKALFNPKTKAIICARGGYGCMRLIPELSKLSPPTFHKLFVGMSDITALNLYLQQAWHWPVIHGAIAKDKFSDESLASLKSVLFGDINKIEYAGVPLNAQAKMDRTIESSITGGNLCLVQTSLKTAWEMDGRGKIIFLEEVSERGYRIDRMLEHLDQAGIFKEAAAILLGDFLEGKEPDGTSLIQPVLERFADTCKIPVVQVKGLGHGRTNFPLPLGVPAQLILGKNVTRVCLVD